VILDAFYSHAGAVPQLASMVVNQIPRLKSAQQAHWQRLFAGTFDDAYMQGVRTIGLTHSRIGLDPRWYIGGYLLVLNMLAEIATTNNSNAQKAAGVEPGPRAISSRSRSAGSCSACRSTRCRTSSSRSD